MSAKIAYNCIRESAPLRVVFQESDFLSITAKEAPEEAGVYWLNEEGELLAIEFDNVDAQNYQAVMTVPETSDRFVLCMRDGELSILRNGVDIAGYH